MIKKLFTITWRKTFPFLQRKIPSLYGNKLLSLVNKASLVFNSIYENSNYDQNSNGESWLLRKISQINPRYIFDVGANVGDYANIAMTSCPKSIIYCFEPIPEIFNKLKRNMGNKERIKLYELALSENSKGLTLFYDPASSGNTTAIEIVQDTIHNNKNTMRIKAKTMSLDQFCSSEHIDKIDFLKIDVEGFENFVLIGANNMIDKGNISIIQFEYGRANIYSKFFLYDYFQLYSEKFFIGKLYPFGVRWFDAYNTNLEDFYGPNIIMLSKARSELYDYFKMDNN